MRFVPIPQQRGLPTDWDPITHIRLIPEERPSTPRALERWRTLCEMANPEGIIERDRALSELKAIRNRGDNEASVKYDLRCWSNPKDHGNNSQDKGWLELGKLVGG